MEEENKYFNQALTRFVKDFGGRNEVIAKFKHGKSFGKIKSELAYPLSDQDIADFIWDYVTDSNIDLKKQDIDMYKMVVLYRKKM